jgi:hypothetical protein
LTEFRASLRLAAADPPEWRDRPDEDLTLAVALAAWLAERLGHGGTMAVHVEEPPRDHFRPREGYYCSPDERLFRRRR